MFAEQNLFIFRAHQKMLLFQKNQISESLFRKFPACAGCTINKSRLLAFLLPAAER
jgi:hypothetical protein